MTKNMASGLNGKLTLLTLGGKVRKFGAKHFWREMKQFWRENSSSKTINNCEMTFGYFVILF